MKDIVKQERDKRYNDYVKDVTPKTSLPLACLKAFISGGIICTIGQIFTNLFIHLGEDKEDAALFTMLVLILASVLLTGFNVYPLLAKWCGAGTLVPITGFANSLAAAAIEYGVEGEVFGKGTRIFVIAGPVILYGIFSSWLLGLCYWIFTMWA